MEGWIYIVLIALLLFAGFIIYDKRKFIVEKIKKYKFPKIKKEKIVKEKKEKPVKEKAKVVKEKKVKQKENIEVKQEPVDYDKIVVEDNVIFGYEPPATEKKAEDLTLPENNDLDEDIDLDKLFEQLRQADAENSQKYRENRYNEPKYMPDFNEISNDELDYFLENSFSFDDVSDNIRNPLQSYGQNKSLSGAELGNMIKQLPPEIKAIIISDILKPKF